MAFIPYETLTEPQREEAKTANPKWAGSPEDLGQHSFWVKPDGHVSQKAGHHRLTKAAAEALVARLPKIADIRSRADLGDWDPATVFGLDRGF